MAGHKPTCMSPLEVTQNFALFLGLTCNSKKAPSLHVLTNNLPKYNITSNCPDSRVLDYYVKQKSNVSENNKRESNIHGRGKGLLVRSIEYDANVSVNGSVRVDKRSNAGGRI